MILNIFNDNAFGVVPLTDAINNLKYVPGQIGAMGIFQETPVATTTIALESKNNVLGLVAPSPRGGPGSVIDQGKRSLRNLSVPHFEIADTLMAEEIQGVRAWGSETELETIQGKVMDKLAVASQNMEATQEYARIGAIKGIISYADGSSTNLFTEFGVAAPSAIDFDLDNASPASGALRKKCAAVWRTIALALDGVPFTGVTVLCSPEFFDDLIAHAETREIYLNQVAAAELRGGYAFGTFSYGGLNFVEYRGQIGNTSFIAAGAAHAFPTGTTGLMRTYYAPADLVETVNTMGQRLYVNQYGMANRKGIHLDTQMNALNICTRPQALIPLTRT